MALRKPVTPKASTFEGQQQGAGAEDVRRQLNLLPFSSGKLFEAQMLTAGTTRVYHQLGYVPKGYILLNAEDAIPGFFRTISTTDYIEFASLTDCKVKLWVF